MNDEIATLRAMAEDVTLPPEVRQEAMARLAELLPAPFDQAMDLVRLMPVELVEDLAFWPTPGE